ncbi:hypothetical protein BDP27DRAFT_1358149 [Rhodocollybia butyracea]|uniref:Uncharacterized protein n=1 Tax=Rhodocollybia butyracea TaxID=206335 RepID=A0A9P5UEC1_9AGAR|nr:hypothetical protein BDP27DRAFT_1358149 [Rhodocollybia butyracea]
MSICNMTSFSSSASLADNELNFISSSSLSSIITASESESTTLPSFIPVFPCLPNIRVPPSLILSEIPLRERRGFVEFIHIIPGSALVSESTQMPAKGQLEPRAGTDLDKGEMQQEMASKGNRKGCEAEERHYIPNSERAYKDVVN